MSFDDILHAITIALLIVTGVFLCLTAYELRKGRRMDRAHEQRMAEIRNGRNQ